MPTLNHLGTLKLSFVWPFSFLLPSFSSTSKVSACWSTHLNTSWLFHIAVLKFKVLKNEKKLLYGRLFFALQSWRSDNCFEDSFPFYVRSYFFGSRNKNFVDNSRFDQLGKTKNLSEWSFDIQISAILSTNHFNIRFG